MKDKLVLLTGASSGIGRAAAMLLAREGADLVLGALAGDELDATVVACTVFGGRVAGVATDVSNPQSVAKLFDAAEAIGHVDGVFNNAGVSTTKPLVSTTDEDWHRLVSTNLSGCFYVAREAARRMIPQRRGCIVNTGSELGHGGQSGYVAYTATKGGILAMTRALAAELAPFNIRVNSVSPGTTDTPMLQAEFASDTDPAGARTATEATIPLRRLAAPEEIARAVLFLLSDEASYATGADFVIDGGRINCLM